MGGGYKTRGCNNGCGCDFTRGSGCIFIGEECLKEK